MKQVNVPLLSYLSTLLAGNKSKDGALKMARASIAA
jgi:hypothetical protein